MDRFTTSKPLLSGGYAKTSATPPKSKLRRPDLGQRHKSAPLVTKTRSTQPQHVSSDGKSHDASEHGSKASSRKGSWSQKAASRRPSQISELEQHPLLKLVVVGNSEVGKTSFVRHALELRKPTASPISSGKVSFGGVVYRVQITELHLKEVKIENGRHISWPKYVHELPFSSPDAVVCMYSITDSESIAGIPHFLSALSNLDTPVQLVTSKIDAPDDEHELDSTFTDKVRSKFPHVLLGQTSTATVEFAKKCMLAILKAILGSRPGHESEPVPSMFGTTLSSQPQDPTTLPICDQANLAGSQTSEVLAAGAEPRLIHSDDEDDKNDDDDDDDNCSEDSFDMRTAAMEREKALMRLQTCDLDSTTGVLRGPHTPVSESEPFLGSIVSGHTAAPQTPESYNVTTVRPGTADSRAHQTFFNLEDESPTVPTFNEDVDPKSPKLSSNTRPDGGVLLSELVDRLLQLPSSKSDSKFAPSFLCLYRTFTTPARLLIAIINRFMRVETSDLQQLMKIAELLRYLQVIAQWTASYPGDFAESSVRELATTFLHGLEKDRNLGPAAREITNNLRTFVYDEDQDWAFSDSKNNQGPPRRPSSDDLKAAGDSDSDEGSDSTKANRSSARNSGTPSTTSSIPKWSIPSSQSASNLAALESAKEQAKKLKMVPHISLSKTQWRMFIETPTEELAREITRIDWTMYTAIRPRDFVRHVTKPRNRNKADNIGTMIKHFNHLALFVAGVILLRDKPKHRAKALEKFMDLAWKVRQLNNYNSLAALVAGITSHEVVRLGQTHELVPAETKKQFLRLTILMANAKSYATYRMAWENSFAERIPFVSALLRDLTLAAGANPTFIGNGINWKKFEIMGDSIVSVQKSYEHPYSFPDKTQRLQELTRMLLETKIVESTEDSADPHNELYDRSVQVEPQAGATDNKKKFDWLRR